MYQAKYNFRLATKRILPCCSKKRGNTTFSMRPVQWELFHYCDLIEITSIHWYSYRMWVWFVCIVYTNQILKCQDRLQTKFESHFYPNAKVAIVSDSSWYIQECVELIPNFREIGIVQWKLRFTTCWISITHGITQVRPPIVILEMNIFFVRTT